MSTTQTSGILESVEWRPAGAHPVILWVVDDSQQGYYALCAAGTRIYTGERVTLWGYWCAGQAPFAVFDAERVVTSTPANATGLVDYLNDALDCGVPTAQLIVSQFGDRTVEVLDQTPARLTEIEGIDDYQIEPLAHAWQQARLHNRARSMMQRMGLSDTQAARLERDFASNFDELIAQLERDPYWPFLHYDDVAFADIDAFALANDGTRNAKVRLRALIVHQVRRICDSGHTYIPRAQLIDRLTRLLKRHHVDRNTLTGLLNELVRDMTLAETADRVYLPALKQIELDVLDALAALEDQDTAYEDTVDWSGLDRLLEAMHMPGIPAHHRPICTFALCHSMALIDAPRAGDADQIAASLAQTMAALSARYVVTCPNAPMAARLTHAYPDLSFAPLTGLLGMDASGYPAARPDKPLHYDCVIVAGADQLDIRLFRDLLRGCAPGTGVLLVGDTCMQTSRDPGHPYNDLIATERIPVHQATIRAIADCPATAVYSALAGEVDPASWLDRIQAPVSILACEDADLDVMVSDLCGVVADKLGLETIQLAVPSRATPPGAQTMRRWRGEIDNWGPDDPKSGYREGEPILFTRDRLALGVRAGEIVRVTQASSPLTLASGKGLTITPDHHDERVIDSASVLTPHMLHANRWPGVVLIVSGETRPLLINPAMLYTMACAAQHHLFIVGDAQAVLKGFNPRAIRLWSGFAELIRETHASG